MACHGEAVNGRRVVIPCSLLLCVVPHALANVALAALAPDVEWHFEANDENALVQLAGAVTEWVLALVFVDRALYFKKMQEKK